jgi:trehalose 6-phosphate synthase/phosphatase
MSRLITISNRLPISLVVEEGKEIAYTQSAGGLATGLKSFHESSENLWVGWPGTEIPEDNKAEVIKKMKQDNMLPVFLTEQEVEAFYEGFSNKTIWPLFHYFKEYTEYNYQYWEVYEQVNRHFADEVIKVARDGDIFWVHDYQLMLVPGMLREAFPNATIGFFLHIPFPSYELFRTLPWRQQILDGLLGADLIGFHTYDYVRHFLSAAKRIRNYDYSLGRIHLNERYADVDSFPMGIDYEKFSKAIYEPETINEVLNLRNNYGQVKLILSIDRLDYSKGILQRLEGYNRFLEDYPDYQGEVSLVLVLVPSRVNVAHYKQLKEQIDEAVGRINGKYSTPNWTCIHYFYRALPFSTLSALYYTSDVALITPYRDGMNLIAKEYVATRIDKKGVLILSEMAGASKELCEAILINPNDVEGIKDAIHEALNLPEEEKVLRNNEMHRKLERYNVQRWAKLFIKRLHEARHLNKIKMEKHWNETHFSKMLKEYQEAKQRIFFLDYDGTLVGFDKDPLKALPTQELLDVLKQLTADPKNHLVLISGRAGDFLEKHLGHLPVDIIAEHGVWTKEHGKEWETTIKVDASWKGEILDIMESFVDRTPGSFIEEKKYSLVWHYRKVDLGLSEMRAHELVDILSHRVSDLGLQILEGNKVIEVKMSGINKGKTAQRWLDKENWDFVFAAGDDFTDEDTFRVLGANAYSLKVGFVDSVARFHIPDVEDVISLLKDLTSHVAVSGLVTATSSKKKETSKT